MFNKGFWLDNKAFWLETVQSMLQSFVAAFLSAATFGSDVKQWNLLVALTVGGGAALIELGRSILAARPVVSSATEKITTAIVGQPK